MTTTGTCCAIVWPTVSTPFGLVPDSSAADAGGVDHRTVGERVGERHPELDQVGARLHVGEADALRGREVRETAHHVGHQRGAAPLGAR